MGIRSRPVPWRHLAVGVLLVASAAVVVGPRPSASAAQPPNVLLIVTDDQAWTTFDRGLMPNVFEKIGDEGVLFRRAYVNTSLCCPSRAQILTGLYEHHTGVDSNSVPLNRPTIVHALDDAGYRTMLAGKFLNSESCDPRPEYDEWICGTQPPSEYGLRNPLLNVNGAWNRFTGYTTDILAGQVLDFIESTPSEQPFFAFYSPPSPHLPANDDRYSSLPVPPLGGPSFDEETRTSGKPEHMQRPPLTAGEKATIHGELRKMTRAVPPLDDAIGGILDGLGDRADNTLVVFMSDNGYHYGEHRRWAKISPYEEATRVPMAIRFPAAMSGGPLASTASLVMNVDVAPTIADAAGIEWGADGSSLIPLLAGEAESVRDSALLSFCQGTRGPCPDHLLRNSVGFFFNRQALMPSYWGVVTDRYKYVEYRTGEKEMYDLLTDPSEIQDLAGDPSLTDTESALAHHLESLRSPPEVHTTIVSGPTGASDTRAASFAFFSQSRFATYSCRLVSGGWPGPWEPCNGGSYTIGSLPDGDHLFEVFATDESGSVDSTPATRSFSIATSGPEATVESHPPEHVRNRDTAFSFSSPTPDVSFECSLGSLGSVQQWAPCSEVTGATFGPLSDGLWNFEVRAVGPTGSVTDPPAQWLFRVDNVGPRFLFDNAPPEAIGPGVSTRFVFHPSEAAQGPFICQLDLDAPEDCSEGVFSHVALPGGDHALKITGTDVLGNVATTTRVWEVDEMPPVPSVAGTSGVIASESASFKMNSSELLGGFFCGLDGNEPWICAQRANYSGLTEGTHTFTFRAYDRTGNFSPPVTRTWIQDTVAPRVAITSGPSTTTKLRTATIVFMVNEPATVRCRLDDRPESLCSSGVTYKNLVLGRHTFTLRARDAASNVGTATISWRIVP